MDSLASTWLRLDGSGGMLASIAKRKMSAHQAFRRPTMTVSVDEKLLHAPEDAARLLSIGRAQLYELLARGDIESIKLGRLRRIPHDALTAYVDRLRSQA
jgi:excisionase family DNA binding protein